MVQGKGFWSNQHSLENTFNGLVDGKIYRKPWFLPSNIGLYHHPILWHMFFWMTSMICSPGITANIIRIVLSAVNRLEFTCMTIMMLIYGVCVFVPFEGIDVGMFIWPVYPICPTCPVYLIKASLVNLYSLYMSIQSIYLSFFALSYCILPNIILGWLVGWLNDSQQ